MLGFRVFFGLHAMVSISRWEGDSEMGYYEDIMNASSKVKRAMFDESVRIYGREVSAVRLSADEDMFHDITNVKLIDSGDSRVDVIINFPDEVPIDRYRMSDSDATVTDTRMFFFDLLPVVAYAKLSDAIEVNDLLFFVLYDEVGNKIPMLFQVVAMFGKFETSLIWKKMNIAPYHGALSKKMYEALQYSYDPPDEKKAPLITQEEPVDTKIVRASRAEEFLNG